MMLPDSVLALSSLAWVFMAGVILFGGILLLLIAHDLSLYVQAVLNKAEVGLLELVTMRFRKVAAPVIVLNKIKLVKSGIHEVTTNDLECHYLAGGRVQNVTHAMIAANRAVLNLDWKKACAIDLAGRDIIDAVNTSVNPKVIDCPGQDKPGADRLDAVAKDGIRLLCRARVTVRTNIDQLIGGATEETVIARVGQAIVSAIGSCMTYKEVLANPDAISRNALRGGGLAAGTAFEILSVDIADISVAGVEKEANVGAKLQTDQAHADMKMRQAEAEGKAAMARAEEAVMRARVQEMRAKVTEAEAQIPLAMAEAFRSGNLGIMDYYRLKNIDADTSMRRSIGTSEEPPQHRPPDELGRSGH